MTNQTEQGAAGWIYASKRYGHKMFSEVRRPDLDAAYFTETRLLSAPPEYPEMPARWAVVVLIDGEEALSIGDQWVSGKGELNEPETQAVVGAAQHLLSFVGYGLPQSSFDPDDDQPAAVSTPEGYTSAAWTDVAQGLPEPQMPVLLDIGRKYPIRAMWVAAKTLPVGGGDDDDFGEYAEDDDEWYCPAGWYEWNEHEERHWSVSAKPLRWMPLPVAAATAKDKP
ncbi:hypothetical protein [Pseudorhodoferax sp. Leaf265]|uniref:hypothetical protein n=1 Tax=Pseudorhodoferax sp. Leaf265 TaxID=1736315 RepID=UPI0006F3F93B|nr:hypothetical protein [Pseudorhodoferax sp. Leaf265]KQP02505.1 hypothetical protein ASF45_20850 [Pseudorhodoferax sp. Leaf265]